MELSALKHTQVFVPSTFVKFMEEFRAIARNPGPHNIKGIGHYFIPTMTIEMQQKWTALANQDEEQAYIKTRSRNYVEQERTPKFYGRMLVALAQSHLIDIQDLAAFAWSDLEESEMLKWRALGNVILEHNIDTYIKSNIACCFHCLKVFQ